MTPGRRSFHDNSSAASGRVGRVGGFLVTRGEYQHGTSRLDHHPRRDALPCRLVEDLTGGSEQYDIGCEVFSELRDRAGRICSLSEHRGRLDTCRFEGRGNRLGQAAAPFLHVPPDDGVVALIDFEFLGERVPTFGAESVEEAAIQGDGG